METASPIWFVLTTAASSRDRLDWRDSLGSFVEESFSDDAVSSSLERACLDEDVEEAEVEDDEEDEGGLTDVTITGSIGCCCC